MSDTSKYVFHLSLDQVNTVLKALGMLPFNEVYSVIHEIHQQAAAQMPPDNQAEETPEA